MTFVADAMLGKVARWLRILGYDTVYEPSHPLERLVALSNERQAVFLTRRKSLPPELHPHDLVHVPDVSFDGQLRFIIGRCGLATSGPLFTRCLACNVPVERIDKEAAVGRVPERSLLGFEEFFECPECRTVTWYGAHHANTLHKLRRVLDVADDENIFGKHD